MRKSTIAKCFSIAFVVLLFLFCHNQTYSQKNAKNSQNQQPQTNTSVQIAPTPTLLPTVEPTKEQLNTVESNRESLQPNEKPEEKAKTLEIFLAVLTLIFVATQATFAVLAWRVMRGQANTMGKQAETMEIQAVAMKDQNDIMQTQTKTMDLQHASIKQQAQTMNEQAETMNKQFGIMQDQTKLMEETLEETRKTIIENYRTFKIANRAYLGMKKADLEQKIEVGKFTKAIIEFTNTGNTPAMAVRGRQAIGFMEANLSKMSPLSFKEGEFGSSVNVFKDGVHNFDICDNEPMDEETMESFRKGKYWLYVRVKIEYKDVFNELHTTNFCAFHRFVDEGTRLNAHSIGNESD
jgi:hypothetical protein